MREHPSCSLAPHPPARLALFSSALNHSVFNLFCHCDTCSAGCWYICPFAAQPISLGPVGLQPLALMLLLFRVTYTVCSFGLCLSRSSTSHHHLTSSSANIKTERSFTPPPPNPRGNHAQAPCFLPPLPPLQPLPHHLTLLLMHTRHRSYIPLNLWALSAFAWLGGLARAPGAGEGDRT